MAANRTFSIIKPDATRRNLTGAVTKMLEEAGLRVVARFSTARARPDRAEPGSPAAANASAGFGTPGKSASPIVGACTVGSSRLISPPRSSWPRIAMIPPARRNRSRALIISCVRSFNLL